MYQTGLFYSQIEFSSVLLQGLELIHFIFYMNTIMFVVIDGKQKIGQFNYT